MNAAVTTPVAPPLVARQDRMFHTGMAIAILLTVVIGFGPTYFYKPFHESAPLSSLLHFHGLLFTTWLLLLIVQGALIRANRVALHMNLGIFGAVLAAVMVPVGIKVAFEGVRRGTTADGLDPLGFMIFPFGQVIFFGVFIALAIWKRKQPELHRRFILMGSICLLTPAISRIVDKRSALAAMLTLLFVIVAMIHDWQTRRRVHPIYIWGGAILFVSGPLRAAIAHSAAWHSFAQKMVG